MNDAERVRLPERAGDLSQNAERATDVERTLIHRIAKALSFDEFQNQKERTVVELSEIGRGCDVRMIDVRRCHRFAFEARDDFRQATHLGVKNFHREPLSHVRVLGLIDRAHSAFAEQLFDFVTTAQNRTD